MMETWVNDHLDLYIYAKKIGDIEWQKQILAALHNKDQLLRQELHQMVSEGLWKKFDQINEDLVLVYRQLCHSKEPHLFEELKWKVLLLRAERQSIMEQIRQLHLVLSS
ncbi:MULTISPECIES: hypothetical protein [Aneurinibacillus]|jgi:hypothetical protein|uniref:Uncharacterized protein n=1 Tax=Aneurinibacillus danicus TaxID=267746 RepID=A0A511V105_9BACL|nr:MULTISPECIES: hypothetical protein [Aneurinibacillus]GEN32584.1 hypothetical protein ADA01nite_00440 [Aneurinibacillus danicus]